MKYIKMIICWIHYYTILLPVMIFIRPQKKSREIGFPYSVVFLNPNDTKGGAAILANRLRIRIMSKGINCINIVGNKYSDDQSVRSINTVSKYGGLRKKVLNNLYREFNRTYQDYFKPASMKLHKSKEIKNAALIHLHNRHGSYLSPFSLPLISKKTPIIWTLHDQQAITGHCAYSYNCDKWQTHCGDCPDLESYPSLDIDRSNKNIKDKEILYNNSNLTIVCPSKWLFNMAQKSILGGKKIHLIYNGVDNTKFFPKDKKSIRMKYKLPQDKVILLFSAGAGFKNPFKGGHFIEKLYDQIGKDKELIFLNISSGEALCGENWINTGYIIDEEILSDYYSAADIMLFPSLAENCPLTVLEGMACSLPIVCFDTGGVPELVLHNSTGLVSKWGDYASFQENVFTLLNDQDLRIKMGAAGLERVIEKFTLDQMVENYYNLYNSTLKD